MPHTANRLSILRLLGLEEHYQEDQTRCHLWVNRIWVDPENDVPVHFDNGDSIIAIIADEQLINELTSQDTDDQDSMSLFQQRKHNPVVCQSEHNISDFATVQSNNSAPRRPPQMPTRRFANGDWNRELHNRFLRQAVVEMEEEGPAAYVVTWLLQEHRQPSCWTPRVVKLTEDYTAWSDLIVEAWQDLFAHDQPCKAHWVHPTPAQSSFSTTIGHIILEQTIDDQLASIVITTHRFRRQGQFIAQAAHLVPCLLHRNTILDKVILYPDEEQLRPFCRVRWGDFTFGVIGAPFEPDIVHSGVGLDVLLPHHELIPPTTEPLTIFGEAMHQNDHEEVALMQTNHPSTMASADGMTTSISTAACPGDTNFTFDPEAPAFVPGQPSIATQSEFVQELHDNWHATAFAWEDETPSCTILVWMVDHSWTEPHSYMPRPVRLYADFTTWEERIVTAWNDLLQPGLPRELHLVHPTPPTADHMIAAHVIVIQRPRDDWVTSVVTCLDSTNQPQTMHQAAVTTHEHILLDNLLRIFHLYHACIGQGATHACAAWYDRVPLLLNAPLMGRSGYGIIMFLRAAGAIPPADAINMLQRSVTVSRTRERLTTDVVAHAQWPLESSVARPALKLAEMLAPPTLLQVDFRSVENMRTTIFNIDLGSVQPRASVVKWHPSTQELLEFIPDWQGEAPTGISFFTDGSAANFTNQRRSSAAVVRIIHTACGDRFGGFRCYDTSINGFSPHAEAVAILTAVLWTAQMCELNPHLQGSTFCFHFDCLFAGMNAHGQWRTNAHESIQHLSRAIVHWLETRYRIHAQWHHVKAHSGQPWNEAADAAAWAAVSQWIPQIDFCPIQHQLLSDEPGAAWLWMLDLAEQHHPAVPAITDGIMTVNASAALSIPSTAANHPFLARPEMQPADLQETHLTLTCATANVLTLYQNKQEYGKGITARMESLLQAFADEGINVIGVQETRSQINGHTTCQDFHILSAPATAKGVGGIQLWVRKRWKLPQGFLHIATSNLRIVATDPQYLLVRLCHDGLRLLFLVGHAPNCPTFDEATQFWSKLGKAIPSSMRSWSLIVLVDANARVGSLPSNVLGPAGAEEENIAGECFHQWLFDNNLLLPQTFEQHHQGDHTTWTHSSGSTARLDYIAIDSTLQHPEMRTRIANVDLSTQREDHRALQLELPITCQISKPPSGPRRSASGSCSSSPATPSSSWMQDVHSHAAMLQQWMQCAQPLKPLRAKRKMHLQETTWTLIQAKRFHWNRMRSLRGTWRKSILREIFQTWRWGKIQDDVRCLQPWMRVLHKALALHSGQHHRLCLQVAAAVRHDDVQFYKTLAAEQSDVAADEGITGLWRKIRHLLPKGVAKKRANIRCRGPQVDDLTRHYSNLEAGKEIAYPALLTQCAQQQSEAQADLPLMISLHEIPTRVEVEQVCKLAKKGKAPGLDGIQAEQLQQMMIWHSDIFYHLLFKIWLLSAEPIQFKGGYICSIAKKHGATTAAAMRGIMLLDVLAKLHHALLRRKLLPWATSNKLVTQFGGFKGQQTVFASLYLRSYVRVVEAKKLSLAIVFVDVKNAFHCLLRQHAFGTMTHLPDVLRAVLANEGLDVMSLEANIARNAAIFDSAPATTARLVRDAHCNTWFTCPGAAGCYETTRGSRPGSPIADIAYNILMTALLKDLQVGLHQLPLIQQANSFLDSLSPTIAWVDDIALPLPCLAACQLDNLLQQAMTVVHQTFRNFGLRLNCNAGKTEAILQYRGIDAPACRRERFIDSFGQIDIPGYDPLHIVTKYTHLGIVMAQSCDIQQDLKLKMGKASAAFRSMSKTIFLNRKLEIRLRLKLLETLVLPILFYGCGAWPLLSTRQFASVSSAIVKWQRQIAGEGYWNTEQVTDAEFRARWRLPPLAVRLSKHRLLFLLQLQRHGPQVVWESITAEDEICRTSWLDAARQALQWLGTMIADLKDREWTCEAILTWTSQADATMPNQIRRAVARFLTQEETIHHVARMHRDIRELCQQHGVVFDQTPTLQEPLPDLFPCSMCSRAFSTIQGLNAHQWKQHAHISEERRFVYSGVCECCRKCFWTAQRLQQHLRYSKRKANGCFWWVQRHLDPLLQPERVDIPEPLQGQHRLPCTAAAGPCQLDVTTKWSRDHARAWKLWQHEWHQQGFPEDLSDELCNEVLEAISATTRQWCADDTQDLSWRWCETVEIYNTDPVRHAQAIWAFALWGRTRLYDLLDEIEEVDQKISIETQYLDLLYELPVAKLVDRLEQLHRAAPPGAPLPEVPTSTRDQRAHLPLESTRNAYDHSHALLGQVVDPEVLHWPKQQGVPVCELPDGRKALLIFHLFSGRRREGDCHYWAKRLIEQYFPNFEVIMLSLDTAVGGTHCDLLNGPGLESLHRIAQAGVVAGNLAGPPCETWSAARHLQPPPDSHERWPRPLRSAQRAWGLEYLTHRELCQLATGSALMLSNLKIEITVVLHGGASLLEHPDIPECQDYASIWRTPVQYRLCHAAPGHQRIHIQQWKYGSKAVKPTLIRAMGLPASAAVLHGQALQGLAKPEKHLSGRDVETGQFRTACAKEYPEGLCRALVTALFQGLAKRRRAEGIVVRPMSQLGERDIQWLTLVEHLSNTNFVSEFLPDYQPQR